MFILNYFQKWNFSFNENMLRLGYFKDTKLQKKIPISTEESSTQFLLSRRLTPTVGRERYNYKKK